MPALTNHITTTTEETTQVTPDYCFQKAAETLTGASSTMVYANMDSRLPAVNPATDLAREWRELGIALRG